MDFLEHALTSMPSVILIGKLIPPGIESTIMSLSMIIIGLNQSFLRSSIGYLFNLLFFNVTKDDISERYYLLSIVSFIGTLIPMTYIYCLVPSNKQIKEV